MFNIGCLNTASAVDNRNKDEAVGEIMTEGLNTASAVDNRNPFKDEVCGNFRSLNTASAVDNRNLQNPLKRQWAMVSIPPQR